MMTKSYIERVVESMNANSGDEQRWVEHLLAAECVRKEADIQSVLQIQDIAQRMEMLAAIVKAGDISEMGYAVRRAREELGKLQKEELARLADQPLSIAQVVIFPERTPEMWQRVPLEAVRDYLAKKERVKLFVVDELILTGKPEQQDIALAFVRTTTYPEFDALFRHPLVPNHERPMKKLQELMWLFGAAKQKPLRGKIASLLSETIVECLRSPVGHNFARTLDLLENELGSYKLRGHTTIVEQAVRTFCEESFREDPVKAKDTLMAFQHLHDRIHSNFAILCLKEVQKFLKRHA